MPDSTSFSLPSSVVVRPLARHPELFSRAAEWFVSEWPDWYGPGAPGNVTEDLAAFAASETTLPIGMVVFENHAPVGFAALKAQSIPSHPHLGPWAAAGYVLPSHRGRGIGATLLQTLVAKAHELGFDQVYCGTSTSQSLLIRSAWSAIETTSMQGKPLTIFRSPA